MILKITCTNDDLMPTRSHPYDAGLDLRCAHRLGASLAPGERKLVDTGVKVAIPAGYVGLIHPRSGWAHKYGITVANAPGTVDAGYIGSIKVNLINHGKYPVTIHYGDRIAQLLIVPIVIPGLEKVDELPTSTRGTAGHGSTGNE